MLELEHRVAVHAVCTVSGGPELVIDEPYLTCGTFPTRSPAVVEQPRTVYEVQCASLSDVFPLTRPTYLRELPLLPFELLSP